MTFGSISEATKVLKEILTVDDGTPVAAIG